MTEGTVEDAVEDGGPEQRRGSESVRAVERAIDILEAFVGPPQGLKVVELERRTGIARPTLYRLLRTLEKRHFIRQSSDPTRYELDYGVVSLANTWLRRVDFLGRSEPFIQRLADEVGETVAVSLYRDGKRVYVREIPSAQALTFARGIGVTEPVYRGASGIAILASEAPEVIAATVAAAPAAERAWVRSEIEATQARGYAVSAGVIIPGAVSVAAPIIDAGGHVVGSVGAYGPALRITADLIPRFGMRVRECARLISAVLP